MSRIVLLCLALLTMALCLSATAAADAEAASAGAPAALEAWRTELDRIEARLGDGDLPDQVLPNLRDKVETIRAETADWIAAQTPDRKAVEAELGALGPPPAAGAEPEAENLAKQRAELKRKLAGIEGGVKEAELIAKRGQRLLAEIAEIRRARFAKRLLVRGPSPVSVTLWKQALPQLADASISIKQTATRLVTAERFRKQLRDSALIMGLAVVVALAIAWPLRFWLLRRFGRDPSIRRPTFVEAARATLVVGVVRALLPTAAAALVYIVAVNRGLFTPAGEEIAQALFLAFVFVTWVLAFFRASLSPTTPAWRVLPLPDRFARGVWPFIIALTLVYAVDIVLSEVIATYGARLEVTVLRDYTIAVIVLVLLALLLLRQYMWTPEDVPEAKPRWRTLRLIAAIALLAAALFGVFGFVALTRFIATQFLLTGGLVLLLLILYRLGGEFIIQMTSAETWAGERLRAAMRIEEDSVEQLRFWIGLAYDVFLICLGLILGLFIWGASRQDVGGWVYQALFGFQVGKITVSLVDIAVAVLVFYALVLLTRFVQRMLATRVLPQTRLDVGVRESIRIGTGYVGIVVAAAAGIAALGLDLSNLALIAGALTVGIGFGLQNVVNNFVSGLILLVERPIKIGDWIVVGGQQGYVKRIKVRATEIQTFDRASVFIPNSELISGMVMNWTHADNMGRVIIPVGVAYGSDTEKVREVLIEIGRAHPEVLADPPPSAVFRGFGDSALNFELRCFLENVDRTISVQSDLCFAIDRAFRDRHIEIPFPQQDVYIKQVTGAPGSLPDPKPRPAAGT